MNMTRPLAVCAVFVMTLTAVPFVTRALADDNPSGKEVFEDTCAACHGENGKGILPNMPNFNEQDGVLSLADAVLLDRIENGYSSGNVSIAMPPKGGDDDLTEDDLKKVLAYLHQKFGVQSTAPF